MRTRDEIQNEIRRHPDRSYESYEPDPVQHAILEVLLDIREQLEYLAIEWNNFFDQWRQR
jgi:hypothetical protein